MEIWEPIDTIYNYKVNEHFILMYLLRNSDYKVKI
jgi:hypothetical protein